jgi:hypothetical protein
VTTQVTTSRILAEKALQKTCGQQCVDWAIEMLVRGHDTHHLLRLGAMLPPFNHFEIAELRDLALADLEIADLGLTQAVTCYAVDLLRTALTKDSEAIVHAIAAVSQLCFASNYQKDIFDFYLLDNAYDDLRSHGVQFYWPDAKIDNIVSLMRNRAEQFVRDHE